MWKNLLFLILEIKILFLLIFNSLKLKIKYCLNLNKKSIKVFLDDERLTPEGWIRTYTPTQTIEHIKRYKVSHLSLDHDLGDDKRIGTGYDVLVYLEKQVYNNRNYPLPIITIHSANPSARQRMLLAVKSIERLKQ